MNLSKYKRKPRYQTSSSSGGGDGILGISSSSCIFFCACLLVIISMIFTMYRYTMAAKAIQSGDYGAAAIMMSEGRPYYGYGYYSPYRRY